MLHSLNALRVLAEFWIVRLHIGTDAGSPRWIRALAEVDLMSFFFVLSGFVCMYAQRETDFGKWGSKKQFYVRKLQKTYPLYLFWYTVSCIGTIRIYNLQCPWFWWCFVADLVLLSPWSYCYQTENIRAASWYITALFSLWAMFPFLKSFYVTYCPGYEWCKISLLYLFSLVPWCYLYVYPWQGPNFAEIPLVRLAEFSMGCTLVFTLDKPIHVLFPIGGCVVLIAYYLAECMLLPDLEPFETYFSTSTQCGLVDYNMTAIHQTKISRIYAFKSRFAILWAVLIHRCAAQEARGLCPEFLDSQIFKSLSVFSLQLYLGHFAIGSTIRDLSNEWSIQYPDLKLPADLRTLCVYVLCYATYCYLQPVLDRIASCAGT